LAPSPEGKREHGSEGGRVTLEEISMDVVEDTLDLRRTPISTSQNKQNNSSAKRTKKMTLPSEK
jgi:hypothetical protein